MARITAKFSWSPVGIPLQVVTNGNTYPYIHQQDGVSRASDSRYPAFVTPANTLLTFVASIVIPAGLIAVEYKWNFGDGSIGYGSTVTHTYTVASPQTACTLSVRDNRDRVVSRSQVLNLRAANPITVGSNISMSDIPGGAPMTLVTSLTQPTNTSVVTNP